MVRVRVKMPVDEDIATTSKTIKRVEKDPKTVTNQLAYKKPKKTLTDLKALKRLPAKPVLNLCIGLTGLLIIGLLWNNIRLSKQLKDVTANPQLAVEWQNEQLLKQISHITQLPTDEVPIIATVSDASQAKTQSSFFVNAENGDKVVQYVKADKVILYRPSTQKIIEIGPFSLIDQS